MGSLKRIAAILLMGILIFNWYGYRLVSSWLEDRADRQLEARLDSDNYDESQLITIKVPSTHLAYYNTSTQYERVNGEIAIGAVRYKYVERRIVNDSMELRCIPNQTAMSLESGRTEFFKLVNDIQQHSGQGKKSDPHSASKSFSAIDYFASADPYIAGSLSFISLTAAADRTPDTRSSYFMTVEQPPDHLSC